MAKRLAVYVRGDRVYLAIVENNKVISAFSKIINVSIVTDEAITQTLKEMIKTNNIKSTDEVCMTVLDGKCLSQTIDTREMHDQEFRNNLPYEFKDYISRGSEEEYIFDYQTLPQNQKSKLKKSLVYAIAAPRVEISKIVDIAEDAHLDMYRLVPERVAYGDILAKAGRDAKRTIILDVSKTRVSFKVFNGRACVAMNEMNDGLGDIDMSMLSRSFGGSMFEGEEGNEDLQEIMDNCRPAIDKIIGKVQDYIDFYMNNKSISEKTPIFMAGEGAVLAPFVKELSVKTHRACKNIAMLIDGGINDYNAAMMAPAIGSAYEIKE